MREFEGIEQNVLHRGRRKALQCRREYNKHNETGGEKKKR